jgi:hypothetical protein
MHRKRTAAVDAGLDSPRCCSQFLNSLLRMEAAEARRAAGGRRSVAASGSPERCSSPCRTGSRVVVCPRCSRALSLLSPGIPLSIVVSLSGADLLDRLDRVGRLDVEGDGLAREGLHEDLHRHGGGRDCDTTTPAASNNHQPVDQAGEIPAGRQRDSGDGRQPASSSSLLPPHTYLLFHSITPVLQPAGLEVDLRENLDCAVSDAK